MLFAINMLPAPTLISNLAQGSARCLIYLEPLFRLHSGGVLARIPTWPELSLVSRPLYAFFDLSVSCCQTSDFAMGQLDSSRKEVSQYYTVIRDDRRAAREPATEPKDISSSVDVHNVC